MTQSNRCPPMRSLARSKESIRPTAELWRALPRLATDAIEAVRWLYAELGAVVATCIKLAGACRRGTEMVRENV
jgi:hypothetical protein